MNGLRGVLRALAVVAGLVAVNPAQALPGPVGGPPQQGLLCRSAIQQADVGSGLPAHMLIGIARVEAGRSDPITGEVHPWPWSINAEGQGHFFDTKADAIAFAQKLQARGIRSIDVGCMQINLMHHPDAFHGLDEAFDPSANARYAVRFLKELRDKTGSWETASAWYHSANPQEGGPYRQKVVSAMAQEGNSPNVYAALPQVFTPSWPVAATPLRGMLVGHGSVAMLPRAATGVVLAQPSSAVAGGAEPIASAAPLFSGRGLDAYRQQPIRVVKPRIIAMQ